MDNKDDNNTDADKASDAEDEFNWQDYLEATNTKEVPHTMFAHVEQSLQNGFEEGMKLEVPLKDKADCHWIATVVMSCGPLLRLRYEGETDRKKDFWCDTTQVVARPLGWCEANRQTLEPPDDLAAQVNVLEVKQKLKDAVSVPPELLSGEGCTPVDRIKPGMKVEVQDPADPYRMWVATILENVGGRLLLRYDTPEGVNLKDFWLFYSSTRIYPMGWANERGPPWVLRKPSIVSSNHKMDEWLAVLDRSKAEAAKLPFPRDILNKSRKSLCPHDVAIGNKLEAIHPGNMTDICPATVVKIFDSYYFLVAIDVVGVTENHQLTWLATSTHPYIFPVGWAAQHRLKVTHPRGWTCGEDEFDWTAYLTATDSVAAVLPPRAAPSHGVGPDMKLEAVDIDCPHHVCVATVRQTTDQLLWIHLESVNTLVQKNINERFWTCFKQTRAVSWDSLDIFPVGWCESNSYPLKAPKITSSQVSSNKSSKKEEAPKKTQPEKSSEKSSSWCPKIYFNHTCFSGPFLSKNRLAGLSRHVGPGPIVLVMKEVLSMLISVAYVSSRVLKELQCPGPPRPGMHLEMLKAKYKTNVYRASVEICTSADKVPEFCKEVCRKLQVCPNLISPESVGFNCPERCHTLSKTRFLTVSTASSQSTLTGQRKPGRPPDSRKQTQFPWPRRPPSTRREYLSAFKKADRSNGQSDSRSANEDEAPKDKRMRYETRGIKLPNFGLKSSQIRQSLGNNDSRCHTPSSFLFGPRKRGRRSKAETEILRKLEELVQETKMDDSQYHVETNPLLWTIEDVYQYMKRTRDCDILANLLRDEEFDGKALMLLNLPSCLEELNLNQKMALRLCRHVEAVKFAFYSRFVTDNPA